MTTVTATTITPKLDNGNVSTKTKGSRVRRDRMKELVPGYPNLAGKMEIYPSIAIFRRFGALNARNLLYLQSDLSDLEDRLKKLELRDSRSGMGTKARYATDAWMLLHPNKSTYGDDCREQKYLLDEIMYKIERYRLLIQQANVLNMKCPDEFDMKHMQNFLVTDDMGPLILNGIDACVWGSYDNRQNHADDLIALKPRQEGDVFSRWLGENAIKYLHKFQFAQLKKKDPILGVVTYKDASIFRYTFWLTSAIASLVPIMSIVVLGKFSSKTAKMESIAAFSVLVTVCLNVFTEAKRTDVFAITAALCIVQVVFLGIDGNCSF